MPFAGFKDFNACVASQKAKGHSDKSAAKICGAIKHKVEGSISEEEYQKIVAEAWLEDNLIQREDKNA